VVAIRDVKKQEPDRVNAKMANLQRNAQEKVKKKKKCIVVGRTIHHVSGLHGVIGAVWKIMVVQQKQEPERVNAKIIVLQINAQEKEHKKRMCTNVSPQHRPRQSGGQRKREKE